MNITYNIPSKNENKQSISLTGNAQDVSDDIEKPSLQSTSKLYLINLGYTLTTQAKWSFARGNYSQNKVQGLQLNRTGFWRRCEKIIV
jgi:exopolyphosphatase/pppGpp-phosphohydrolase